MTKKKTKNKNFDLKNNAFHVAILISILAGFVFGFIIGFVGVGVDIQNQCEESINSYENYINNYCGASKGVNVPNISFQYEFVKGVIEDEIINEE